MDTSLARGIRKSMAARRLPPVVRVDNHRPVHGVAGIGADEDCVCGSYRKARSCHQAKDRSWTDAVPDPLITGPVTGFANPRCYGRSSNDCSEKVSREHWISAGIQRCIMGDGALMWQGSPWLSGEVREVGVGSGASKVLCVRHNVALSPLDAMAEVVFRRISEGQVSLATEERPGNEFTLCSGPLFERWLLKVIWGGVASRSFGQDGVPLAGLREDADLSELADALWRGGPLPTHWGFHSVLHEVDPKGTPESIGIQPFSSFDRLVYGAAIDIGALRVIFAFGSPDYATHYRPSGVRFRRQDDAAEKVIGFSWPEAGHPFIEYLRTPPSDP